MGTKVRIPPEQSTHGCSLHPVDHPPTPPRPKLQLNSWRREEKRREEERRKMERREVEDWRGEEERRWMGWYGVESTVG